MLASPPNVLEAKRPLSSACCRLIGYGANLEMQIFCNPVTPSHHKPEEVSRQEACRRRQHKAGLVRRQPVTNRSCVCSSMRMISVEACRIRCV